MNDCGQKLLSIIGDHASSFTAFDELVRSNFDLYLSRSVNLIMLGVVSGARSVLQAPRWTGCNFWTQSQTLIVAVTLTAVGAERQVLAVRILLAYGSGTHASTGSCIRPTSPVTNLTIGQGVEQMDKTCANASNTMTKAAT